jgi:copper chaperone CopZ
MITKQIFKIEGMHCSSCAMAIDGELEDMAGIKESNTNFAKGITEVIFDSKKINVRQIIGAIKKAGYIADLNKL